MLDAAARTALAGTRFTDIREVGETGSTNDDLMQLATDGAPEGVVILAGYQTAGRGRGGRPWVAPPQSSLLVSVLLRPALPPDLLPLMTLAAALAASAACSDVAGFRPSLKWPNDLVVGSAHGQERKLGGVLAEMRMPTRRRRQLQDEAAGGTPVVVGLGLNANWDAPPPEIAGIAVAANQVARRPVDRPALLVAYLRNLDQRCDEAATGEGRSGLITEYRRHCSTLGRAVRVELARETVEGRAVDIGSQGHLVVQLADGSQRTVRAGDVSHLDLQP